MKRNTSNWSNFCMLLRRAGFTASAGLSCKLTQATCSVGLWFSCIFSCILLLIPFVRVRRAEVCRQARQPIFVWYVQCQAAVVLLVRGTGVFRNNWILENHRKTVAFHTPLRRLRPLLPGLFLIAHRLLYIRLSGCNCTTKNK